MKKVFILFFNILFSANAVAIVGGHLVENKNSFPGIMRINSCGAVKVSDKHILTAAHCVAYHTGYGASNTSSIRNMKLIFGTHPTNETYIKTYLEKVYMPESAYLADLNINRVNLETVSDIAILEVSPSHGFSSISTAEVYSGTVDNNSELWLVGYGGESDKNMTLAEQKMLNQDTDPYKHHGRLRAVKTSLKYVNDRYITPEPFTTLGNSSRAYRGDSGSPLYVEVDGSRKVVGVASTILRHDVILSNYTKVSNQYIGSWVKDVLSNKIQPVEWSEKIGN